MTNDTACDAIDWWTLFTDPAFVADPHPHLRRIRDMQPIHQDPVTGIFFILGYEEFNTLARAPEMGRDTRLWTHGWSRPEAKEQDPLSHALFSEFQRQMVNSNPPDHRRMRDVYEKAFRPAAMPTMQAMIEEECRQLLAMLPAGAGSSTRAGEPFDFMTGFANRLPLRVARNLFEIPAGMDGQLAQWHNALVRIGDIMMTVDQKREALDALRAYKAYLAAHLAARRDNPGDGFLSLAIKGLSDGVMDEDETVTNLMGLASGNETTANLLGNGLLSLLRNPDGYRRLRADPSFMRTAIEEMLRFEPAINFILRVAIEDFSVGGVTIPAGSMAIGLIGAINRDPAKFEFPDTFDIARKPNAQVIFGGGPHVCIGAALARLQGQVAFTAIMERYPNLQLAGEPKWWTERTNQRGLERLSVKG